MLVAPICLLAVFALMVVLMRRGVDVSYALVAGAAAVGVLFGVQWRAFPSGLGRDLIGVVAQMGKAAIDLGNLQLLALILLITLLGHVLKHVASLQRLIAVLKALLGDRRIAMAVAPAFVGLLPMPGGAAFSAPMVGELTDDLEAPSEDRAVINFWFRHIWEWTWPMYPGLLFASRILKAPLERIILAQAPLTLSAIVIGSVLCFRRIELPAEEPREGANAGTWRELVAAVWPVALIVVLTAALAAAERLGARLMLSTRAALLVALAVVVPLFMAFKRVPWREAAMLVRRTVRLRLVVLVYGVLAFGHMLKAYGAAQEVSRAFEAWGVPDLLLLFFVPFVVGVLTGYMPGVVGTCFPLLASLLAADGAVDYGRLAFAYAGGLLGVLTSPVHLCLVLSKEYFSADFGQVYRRLLPPVALLALAALGTLGLWGVVGLR